MAQPDERNVQAGSRRCSRSKQWAKSRDSCQAVQAQRSSCGRAVGSRGTMLSFRRLRYRAARTRLNVPLIWLRHRGLDSADVFLASYPRSGQHWTRFQLFEIMNHACADFESVDHVIPRIGAHGAAPAILPSRGRLVQTHQPWRKEYQRAIYLVRDVRDVVLSVYAGEESLGLTRYFDITNFDGYLLPWLQGKLQIMGNWRNHV